MICTCAHITSANSFPQDMSESSKWILHVRKISKSKIVQYLTWFFVLLPPLSVNSKSLFQQKLKHVILNTVSPWTNIVRVLKWNSAYFEFFVNKMSIIFCFYVWRTANCWYPEVAELLNRCKRSAKLKKHPTICVLRIIWVFAVFSSHVLRKLLSHLFIACTSYFWRHMEPA